jgi:hypothetical protein
LAVLQYGIRELLGWSIFAGNRESKCQGIAGTVEEILYKVFLRD